MNALRPLSFETLLAWALAGLERERSVFGLPQRSFWRGQPGLDLSVSVVGGRAGTPLGPAAGPHTQLAHNVVVAWLAGARVLELKTVQVLDRLEIARPCIDAPAEGYNVEWSQELTLEESLEQYVSAWLLIHVLAARGLPGGAGAGAGGVTGTRFDASVGYDLAGLRSARVAAFLDGLADATAVLDALRRRVPRDLAALAAVAAPARVADTVTLSTFHGCPPEEIERMVEHLFERHRMNVVVKLNPTLLGREEVAHLLHDVQLRRDIVLDPQAFASDLQWPAAIDLLVRLAASARRRGLGLGVKLTNTLVVKNTRGRLAGERVYLSGAPLHPIAIALATRLAASPAGPIPRSLSAGVNAENFADAVACGFAPVTTCTDLLQPTGYRRLPRYLKALETELERTATTSVEGYLAARAREAGTAPGRDAAHIHLESYAARLACAPLPAGAPPAPGPSRPELRFLDCAACNRCTLACPNGAIFAVTAEPRSVETERLSVCDGRVVVSVAAFETRRDAQWVVDAGLCNACGNCDTWCPESGGPERVKPRLHRTRSAYEAAAFEDGILLEAGGERASARFEGVEHRLERRPDGWRFGNATLAATLDEDGKVRHVEPVSGGEGSLDLTRFHALRLVAAAVLADVNPVAAALGGAPAPAHPASATAGNPGEPAGPARP